MVRSAGAAASRPRSRRRCRGSRARHLASAFALASAAAMTAAARASFCAFTGSADLEPDAVEVGRALGRRGVDDVAGLVEVANGDSGAVR